MPLLFLPHFISVCHVAGIALDFCLTENELGLYKTA